MNGLQFITIAPIFSLLSPLVSELLTVFYKYLDNFKLVPEIKESSGGIIPIAVCIFAAFFSFVISFIVKRIKKELKAPQVKTIATGGFSKDSTAPKLNIHCPQETLSPLPEEKRNALIKVLELDPRPAYQDDADRVYGFGFAGFEVKFTVNDNTLYVKEITKAINQFSDEYRIPFTMHIAGFKYNEIAEKMNLPLGTVKSRIFFARQKLQSQLKDYR